jgi:hypothetical protein
MAAAISIVEAAIAICAAVGRLISFDTDRAPGFIGLEAAAE